MAQDQRIDHYIAKAQPFARPILLHLRTLVHRALPGTEETIKWGMPHFTVAGKNLVGIAAFKHHASLVIHNRPAIGEGMGQFGKLSSLADLPSDDDIIDTLKAARTALEIGAKPACKAKGSQKPEFPVPDDFADALQGAPTASAEFGRLAPSHRREYLEWITEAKRPETRSKRIATAVEWLSDGKKRNWKYEKC